MLFNSQQFLFVFLPITVAATFAALRILGNGAAIVTLILASLSFYGSWQWWALWVLLASTVTNLGLGMLMLRRPQYAKGIMIIGVAGNLLLLGYFKYANFFLETIGVENGSLLHVVLPLGISFYTFQKIAFLVDIERGLIAEVKPLEFALMVAFFPLLIAGPIVHYSEIVGQFARLKINAQTIGLGLSVFIVGLTKKVVLADSLLIYAKPQFAAASTGPIEFFGAWIGTLAFTFQLYFDFAGYSDMAIGLALMFGITLPVNFLSPYKSTSIIEFWRRWHMTLSRFLRDYLYVPLGGNRDGVLLRYRNLFLVMLIGGLWHGAAWTFVLWGAIHGLYLILNHLWRSAGGKLPGIIAGPSCFLAVAVAWVFFRSPSFEAALAMLRGMIGLEGVMVPMGVLSWLDMLGYADWGNSPMHPVEFTAGLTLIGIAALIAFAMPNTMQIFGLTEQPEGRAWNVLLRPALQSPVCIGVLLWLSMLWVIGAQPTEFLYFQF